MGVGTGLYMYDVVVKSSRSLCVLVIPVHDVLRCANRYMAHYTEGQG